MSPLLRIAHPELTQCHFDVIAKTWTISQQRQQAYCARALGGLGDKTILVAGCGFGDDVLGWLRYSPRRLIGVDIVNYQECWRQVTSLSLDQQIRVEFLQRDLVDDIWDFVEASSIDVIASHAVLEHIFNLRQFLTNAWHAMQANGLMVGSYGPLWYGPNGDHTFPNCEDDYFNHLLLDDEAYDDYIHRVIEERTHLGHACEGPFLLERGYFSYLRPCEYLEAFQDCGFEVITSVLNLSDAADRYFRRFPERLPLLMSKYGLHKMDLYANGSTVLLRKVEREPLSTVARSQTQGREH